MARADLPDSMTRIFPQPDFPDHGLLDSGGGWKLERYGKRVLARPDPQALWRPRLSSARWDSADLRFVRESDRGGRWESPKGKRGGAPQSWMLRYGNAQLRVEPTPFKHVGVFAEQAANWAWIEAMHGALAEPAPRLLNLFGYTGVASVLAAQAGYRVTHVDASKRSVSWAKENAAASGLAGDALRVIVDDALVFARREVRRGTRYSGIVLDPPHFGRGPKGETWRLEDGLAPLLEACGQLLDERAFLVLSTYAVGYSPLAFAGILGELPGGAVDVGELALREEAGEGRHLPCGFCARWTRGLESPDRWRSVSWP